jgi:hypothetical protein
VIVFFFCDELSEEIEEEMFVVARAERLRVWEQCDWQSKKLAVLTDLLKIQFSENAGPLKSCQMCIRSIHTALTDAIVTETSWMLQNCYTHTWTKNIIVCFQL